MLMNRTLTLFFKSLPLIILVGCGTTRLATEARRTNDLLRLYAERVNPNSLPQLVVQIHNSRAQPIARPEIDGQFSGTVVVRCEDKMFLLKSASVRKAELTSVIDRGAQMLRPNETATFKIDLIKEFVTWDEFVSRKTHEPSELSNWRQNLESAKKYEIYCSLDAPEAASNVIIVRTDKARKTPYTSMSLLP